ncbi:MAG TPA: glycosyltransferase family 2 protein [Ignavibacteriales bacterium]|nr:glycosyltransferase family 2 protein [Ignavibacteriales bacterium]
MNTAAVIPFHNEERFLEELLCEVSQHVDVIIAVNDGSTDNSEKIARKFPKVVLTGFEKNEGKGAALNAGFQKCIEMGIEYAVTLDADLQHDPKLIPNFLEELKSADIVIGNRLTRLKNMPIQRRASNLITSFLLTQKTGIKILDSQCGYRAYKTKILPDILTKSCGFEAESEIIINAARKNLRISFIEIPVIYGNEKSKMKAFAAIAGFIRILFI